jgi:hypothetical protein
MWGMASASGIEQPGVIDGIAEDTRTGEVVLIMVETRPWSGEAWQMVQLQDKLNAYLSFVLDGEMAEAFPALAGKPLRLQIDCVEEPQGVTADFLADVRRQLALQEIGLKTRIVPVPEAGEGGNGCGCGPCGCGGA